MVAFEAIRFPLIFGGFLALTLAAFMNRDKFLPNIEEERQKMYKENAVDHKLLVDKIREMKSN